MIVVNIPKHIEQSDISEMMKELSPEYPLISISLNRTRNGHRATLTKLSGANNIEECASSISEWINNY